jgi:hypothetical protein
MTAVEILFTELFKSKGLSKVLQYREHYLELEKLQIEKAVKTGWKEGCSGIESTFRPEEYYDQTYGKEKTTKQNSNE